MYEVGTITYSVPPIYKLKKGGQGAHDIFRREGGGALALDDEACGPLFIKRGAFSQQQITLKVHSYHLIFHIKHSSGVPADRNSKDSIYWHTRSKIIQ